MLIATTISVLLSASTAGAGLRVDGHAVTAGVYRGEHTLVMAHSAPQQIRGEIELQRAGAGRFRVTARVDLEEYVAAALQSEAGDFQEPEFLKAMAVVIRGYAVNNLHRHGEADMCDATHCQLVRFPASERMRQAAEATRGEVVWYAGKAAQVFYHSHCGGATASAASVWGGAPKPYLVSRRDPYCERHASAWNVKVNKSSLARVAAGAGKLGVGGLGSVRVVSYGVSGRVSRVSVDGQTWTGARFRDLLAGMSGGGSVIRSTRFRVEEAGDSVVFRGKGAGHGVGLCQHGAIARAESGHNYRQILSAYFPGTKVQSPLQDEDSAPKWARLQ